MTLDEMIEYTTNRAHWGSPLIRNQGISFQFAEHHTYIQAARMLLYNALWLRDQGRPHSKETSMAKWFTAEMTRNIVLQCLDIGGYPHWSTESPLAARAMSIIGNPMIDSGPQVHKLRILREIAPQALPDGMADRLVV